MVNAKFEAQRQTIKHYWNIGIRSAKQIHEITSIPLRTVEYNLKKLREIGDVEHKPRIGRPPKVTQEISHMIRQNIRRNNTISTRQLAIKIENIKDISIDHTTVWRHMKKKEYSSSVPLVTPMLTDRHIEMKISWTQAHMNDNWNQTIFTDETAFDLFRNKVHQWHKKGNRPIRRLPKNRQKVMAWGGISKKGKTPLFCFINIMDGPFYVSILQNQLLFAARSMYKRNWHLQQDNNPKHTSRVTKDFIAKNSICTIDWPSNSPDLNPIENM